MFQALVCIECRQCVTEIHTTTTKCYGTNLVQEIFDCIRCYGLNSVPELFDRTKNYEIIRSRKYLIAPCANTSYRIQWAAEFKAGIKTSSTGELNPWPVKTKQQVQTSCLCKVYLREQFAGSVSRHVPGIIHVWVRIRKQSHLSAMTKHVNK